MEPTFTYVKVHPLNLDKYWEIAAPWIMHAIGGPETWLDIQAIREGIQTGIYDLWLGVRTETKELQLVFITETHILGSKPILVIRWLGGHAIDEWIWDLGYVEAWAKSVGYHKIEIWGRRGWERKLKPLQYQYEYTVIGRVIDRGIH